MKNQKRTKKRNVRSEAAMRYAIRYKRALAWTFNDSDPFPEVIAKQLPGHEIIAIFDLRDCYRKRKPLSGVTKAFRRAIQPKRSRK